jgi:uncharacterized protein (TIGR00369 family)
MDPSTSEPVTHAKVDARFSGRPSHLERGFARVELDVTEEMLADDQGLAHGGFVFSLADHAAMLAVNHPNVVLGAAEVRFHTPVVLGDHLVAEARVGDRSEPKIPVQVDVLRRGEVVFSGQFLCFTPERHVLEPS